VSTRHYVHIAFSGLMLLTIIIFNAITNTAVVNAIFKVASYTYGPLLGLYSFGLFLGKRQVLDKLVPLICLISPAICYFISTPEPMIFGSGMSSNVIIAFFQHIKQGIDSIGYVFDNELIIVNGLITFVGLWLTSSKKAQMNLNYKGA